MSNPRYSRSSDQNILVKIGPCCVSRSTDSVSWDDSGLGGKLSQILIYHGSFQINSIQLVYENGENFAISERHGGTGLKFDMIELSGNEYLILIRGRYGFLPYSVVQKVILTLTFVTNIRQYGPYGDLDGGWVLGSSKFCYKMEKGSFAGFHGASDTGDLTSIGVFVKTKATQVPTHLSSPSQTYPEEEE